MFFDFEVFKILLLEGEKRKEKKEKELEVVRLCERFSRRTTSTPTKYLVQDRCLRLF